MKTDILTRLQPFFDWIQQWNLMVGQIWLHPKQADELRSCGGHYYDVERNKSVIEDVKNKVGATLIGYYLGANVYESEVVIENHVAILPMGWDAKLVDSVACMPL